MCTTEYNERHDYTKKRCELNSKNEVTKTYEIIGTSGLKAVCIEPIHD